MNLSTLELGLGEGHLAKILNVIGKLEKLTKLVIYGCIDTAAKKTNPFENSNTSLANRPHLYHSLKDLTFGYNEYIPSSIVLYFVLYAPNLTRVSE